MVLNASIKKSHIQLRSTLLTRTDANIAFQQVIAALASRYGTLKCEEICYVQDCFEALLWHLNYIEHFIQVELIRFSDVKPPLEWAIKRLAAKDIQPLIIAYSDQEGFLFTEMFCNRFDASVWPRIGKESV